LKYAHRPFVPPPPPEGDYVEPAYEKEVQKATRRLEQRYRTAQNRLRKAEQQKAKAVAKAHQPTKAALKRLDAEIELRRQELLALERMMTSFPGGGIAHRGTGHPKPEAQGGTF
jgi:hypothetical protein